MFIVAVGSATRLLSAEADLARRPPATPNLCRGLDHRVPGCGVEDDNDFRYSPSTYPEMLGAARNVWRQPRCRGRVRASPLHHRRAHGASHSAGERNQSDEPGHVLAWRVEGHHRTVETGTDHQVKPRPPGRRPGSKRRGRRGQSVRSREDQDALTVWPACFPSRCVSPS